jgi:putative CocE/NonD family hydrolase
MPYLEHPRYDDHWRTKAIPLEQIEVPAFLIGAWRDIFPEAMVRAYERIPAPRRLLMGPWMHEMPDLARESRVDYLAEMIRWWDRWLRGIDNGVTADPPVTIFVQGAGWRNEAAWPPARTEDQVVHLVGADAPGGLSTTPGTDHETSYRADPTVGVSAGLWDPTGTGLGAPQDQGPDDLRSITFTGDPLAADLEITGSPHALLHVALDEGTDVNLVVKLCDVAPDGRSSLITTGWLKGSHRNGHDRIEPFPTGEVVECRVALWATSYRVPAGHRLRVSVACADFPRIWPTPTNPLIRLATGRATPSSVSLPTVPPGTTPQRDLPVPEASVDRTPLDVEASPRWTIEQEPGSDTVTVTTGIRSVCVTPSRDGRFEIERWGRARVSASHPDAARLEGASRITLRTPSGSIVVVEGQVRVTLTGQDYAGRVTLDGQVIFDRHWGRELD